MTIKFVKTKLSLIPPHLPHCGLPVPLCPGDPHVRAGGQCGGVAGSHLLPAGDQENQSVLGQAEKGREDRQGKVQD